MGIKRRVPKESDNDYFRYFMEQETSDPFVGCGGWSEDLNAEWEKYGDHVLETWTHTRPGTRPAFWWSEVAPEPRQHVGGKLTVKYPALHSPRLINGKWSTTNRMIPFYYCLDIDPGNPPRFESEAAYLQRLGLLLPGELERLTDADFESEILRSPHD